MAYRFGTAGPHILVMGGVHGNESEGVVAAMGLLKAFQEKFDFRLQVTLIPAFNQDGVLAKSRVNSAGVDLNRNLPTKDWTAVVAKPDYNPGPSPNSEPENVALTQWIERNKPRFIWSLHSWKPLINVNGDCLPEAEAVKSLTGYVIEGNIGYPTPGCLGTYAGLERGIPTITYEIERGETPGRTLSLHVPAILEALKVSERRF